MGSQKFLASSYRPMSSEMESSIGDQLSFVAYFPRTMFEFSE